MSETGGASVGSSEQPGLLVLTYNVRYAGLDDGPLAWERRRESVSAAIRAAAPDVVAIQECWDDQLDDLAARLPTYEWIGYPDAVGEHTPVGYNPARVAVASSDAFGLAPGGERGVLGWDAALPRTVTRATLRDLERGNRVSVFSVHLDHRGSRARVEGARLLTRRLPDHPTVVAGDMNCHPGAEPYRVLAGSLRDSYERADERVGPEATYVGFDDPEREAGGAASPDRERIDYVFVRGFGVARYATLTPAADEGRPSDHRPVAVELTRPNGR